MNEELAGLPQDTMDLINLREYVDDMRTKKNLIVDKLETAPLDVPGCDDKYNRFDWYQIKNRDGSSVGYFHTVKGVEL